MRRSLRPLALSAAVPLLAALGAGACEAPSPEVADAADPSEGAFVVLLGTDTVGAERYRATDDRIEVLSVTRSPRTLHRPVVLELDDAGGLARYETRVVDPAAAEDAEPMQRSEIRWDDEGAVVESPAAPEGRRIEAEPDMIPFSLNHFSLAEVGLLRAFEAGRDTVRLLSDGPLPVPLRRPAPDSVVLETQFGEWHARVDERGRIQTMEAGALGRRVVRAPELDVEALARRWADEDARGEGMGPLSPRDTTQATVHGARIEVDYSRPAKRGREVFGGLVPWGEVWRTGADRATHLTTDRPLRIAGETLAPGTYTLFTVPEPDAWTLIVNRQTGQAGTDHDPDQDAVRASMEVAPLDPPEERFTIVVEEDGERGVLRLRWAATEASVPFEVEG